MTAFLLIILPYLSFGQLSTVSTGDTALCVSASVQIGTSPSGGTSYSYSWTPATGLSSTTIANPTATPTVTTTYFVTVTDIPSSNTVTDSVTIVVQNIPPPVTIVPRFDTICQGDTIQLKVGNDPLCGSVQGTCRTTAANSTIGSGLTLAFSEVDNPFFQQNNFFNTARSAKHQYIFSKAEMNANGIKGPTTITAISWDMLVSFGSLSYSNIILKMGCTNDTILTTTFKSGLTTVYGPSSRSFTGNQWQQFDFDNPYVWDGESNIVMEVCYVNASAGTTMPFVRFDTYGSNIANYRSANADICSQTSATGVTNRRPNTRFRHCELVHNATLTYSWTPATGLSSTSARNPFANPNTSTNYLLTTTDSRGCSGVDTASISVAPRFNLTMPSDTSLCAADTVLFAANDNAGAGATYKWRSGAWIENDSLSSTRIFINSNDKVKLEVTSQAGCALTDSFFVNLVAPVSAEILTSDTTICSGDSIPLEVSTNFYSCQTYANIACQSPSTLTFNGTSTFPSGGVTVSPFDGLATLASPGQKKQYLFTATEFAAMVNSTTIRSLGFNVQAVTATVTSRQNFTIKMGCTSTSSFTFGVQNFETGLQTVYTPKTINVGTGWNDFNFDNSFVWDGTSNVIVEICWENSASLGTNFTTLNWTNNTFTCVLVAWNGSGFCSLSQAAFSSTIRPEMRFSHCSSPPNPAYDFVWTPSTGLSNDTVPQPMASPTLSGYYRLEVTDPATGCADQDSVFITVAPDFNTTVTNDSTLCAEDTIQLNVTHNSASGVTFNWMPASEVSDSSISNPTVFVDGLKTIISEVSSTQGCIKWDTVFLGLYDQISLRIDAPPGPFCEGDSVLLDSENSLACGQSNSVLCTGIDSAQIGTSTTTSSQFNVTPFIGTNTSSKKQYIIRQGELNAAGITGSTQLTALSFEVSALGKADFQGLSIKIGCTTASSFSNSFVGGTSVVFDPKDVTLVAGKNWFVFDHRYNWDGASNIVVELCYNNSTTGTNTEVFYTQPNPLYNCTAYNRGNSVCNSGSATAYNRRPNIEFRYCTVNASNYSYSWTPMNAYNDPGLEDPMAEVLDPGVYTLDLTDLSSGCVTTDSIVLNVNSIDVEALEDTSLCDTKGYQLDVLTNAVNPKYSWTPANQLNNDTIRNPIITVDNGAVFIVEVTDSSGCVKEDTVDIMLLPKPTANVSPANVNICRDELIQLQGSGGGTYAWSPSTGLSNPNIASPTASVKQNTTYYLTVTNSFGCTDEDSSVITIYPSPILDLGPDTSYCNGGWILLNAGGEFFEYTWQDNSTDSTYFVDSDGQFWVRVRDAFDCEFTDTVDIGIAPSPVADIDYVTELCEGDSVILDAANPGATYEWSTGESSQTIIVKDSGYYWVRIDNGQCIGEDSTIVLKYEYPVTTLGDKEFYCEKEFPFGMTLTAGTDEYRYLWDNGQFTNSIIVTEAGEYSVEITNGDKCTITKVVEVIQLCKGEIFVPNTFTPNNDWKNDVFSIVARNFDDFEFRVFNRWGEVVFFSTDPEFEWEGDFKGEPVPSGVYVWRLDYKIREADGSFSEDSESGSVTILR